MPLAGDAIGRIGPAERDILVQRHIVADLGRLADHRESMVDEEALADLRTRMDVIAGQEAREMVDRPREEEQPHAVEPVRHPVEGERPDAGIEQNFRAGPRRGIARLHRIQIGNEVAHHPDVPDRRIFSCVRPHIVGTLRFFQTAG